ncbi:putative RNA-directed DNA polymerase [Aphis craccivora]|uniref:Putative RNA-directed DNA polymerase n=1 Tax=Aphis craccivora TaxID=307492 RepID=A0A6G0YF40_APHCR|nr:putative RNA-directed DNA polymerase [Aphis craccivora]
MDLRFKLSSSLDPCFHIEMVCCKAVRVLSIIMRFLMDLNLTSSLKVLYCSLVRPIVEYGSIIWDPHTTDNPY